MEEKTKQLTADELGRLLEALFPWGYATVGETRFIGPVPSRGTYNIMALETAEGYSEPDDIFSFIMIKVMDEDIEDKDLLGFYCGMMSYAFPDFICLDDDFQETGCDMISFKRKTSQEYGSCFFGWNK